MAAWGISHPVIGHDQLATIEMGNILAANGSIRLQLCALGQGIHIHDTRRHQDPVFRLHYSCGTNTLQVQITLLFKSFRRWGLVGREN